MDEFAERLARLAELSAEELQALEQEMTAAFDAADAAGDVATMQALADALDQVREALANASGGEGEAAAPPPVEEAVAAAGEVDEATPTEDAETDDAPAASESTPETPEEPDEPVDPEAPETPDESETPEPEATAEDGETAPSTTSEEENVAKDVTNADVPDAHKPAAVAASAQFAITAGGDIPGVTAGAALADMDEVIEALTRKINGMRGVRGDGEQVIVASLRRDLEAEFGEERMLRRGDPEGNAYKIRQYAAHNQTVESLTAAGWCAPKTPLYDIPGIGTTATPVADSLTSMGADRGGIIWTEPPTLGPMSGLTQFGWWRNTSADPANPTYGWVAGPPLNPDYSGGVPATPDHGAYAPPYTPPGGTDNKPCIDIPCGIEHSAELMALPMCLCFDNLMVRVNPELVKASTDLVQVAHARWREQWLLAQMFGAPGVVNTCAGGAIVGMPDVPLGAARDFLITLRLSAAQFRWHNRIDPNTTLRLYAPSWLHDSMVSDLMVQIPGDQTMAVTKAEINAMINDCGVDPVWYIDDVPAGVGTNPTDASSNFDSKCGYPQHAQWLLTLPGVYVRLDGGSLDLGVVRTKEDVQQNRYCEFSETFESVAYMGPTANPDDAWAFRGTTAIFVRGGFTPAVSAFTGGVITE